MMTSGSARIIERRPVAKVRPALGLTWTCVDALELVLDRVLDRDDVLVGRVELRRAPRRAWCVLPEPVGPVTSTAP